MLTGDLFITNDSIIKSESEFRIVFNCNISHPIFEGHFPGSHVLPGVCMIQFVRESLSGFLKKEYRLYSARSVKFVNMIDPGKEHELFLELKINPCPDELIDVSAQIKSEKTSFFQFRGNYKIK